MDETSGGLKRQRKERRKKMKRYFAVLSIIGMFLSCAQLTSVDSTPAYDSTVTGKRDSEQDVKAVQEAVDKGGTVLLKGTFDFGPKGRVDIKNDVAVWGESDGNGRPLTKIIGTLIQENHIELTNGPKTRGITQFGSNGNITKNKIKGTGAWAVAAISWKSFKGSGNIFEWNDMSEFKASSADIYCTGDKNTFIGPECKVIDKGEGNKILANK
jgi:hypothetical protein